MIIYKVSYLLIIFFIVKADFKGQSYIFSNEFARGISGNTTWLKLIYFTFGQYNRTVKAASYEIDIAMNVTREDDVMVSFSFQIFKNNEYKKTPIVFTRGLCEVIEAKLFDVPNITKNSTMKSCPIKKGRNYDYNMILTSNGWPNYLPAGRYLLKLDFYYRKELILTVEWMVKIIAIK